MGVLNSTLETILQACPFEKSEERLIWLLHRLTGIGLFIFLALHILHIWLAGFGPEPFNTLTSYLNHPAARLLHLLLFFSVLFHAINGLRIIVLDLLPRSGQLQRYSIQIAAVIFLLILVPTVLLIVMDAYLP